MNYLKQALTEYLSGLTTKKNDKEIWIKDRYGLSSTVESIDDENYIVRGYFAHGSLQYEQYFKNDKQHGLERQWWGNEVLYIEMGWKDGNLHGVNKGFHMDGSLWWEEVWFDGMHLVK